MRNNVTRQQHYVWRYYLEAWETDGQLFASHNGAAPFPSSARGIGKQRDFYRLPRLVSNDLAFISETIDRMELPPEGRKAAYGWLRPWLAIHQVEQHFAGANMPTKVRSALTDFEIQAEERFHSWIETDAVPMLRSLREGDASFWNTDKTAMSFSFFISLQHLRTKRMVDQIPVGIENQELSGTISRTWPYLKFAFASNMGLGFYRERTNWRLRLASAPQNIGFITSDQPTMNLTPGNGHYDLMIYYPISPELALFIEHDKNPTFALTSGTLTVEDVDGLNLRMARNSHAQIYGLDGEYLAGLVSRVK